MDSILNLEVRNEVESFPLSEGLVHPVSERSHVCARNVIGRRRKHVCAFVRARNGTALVTAVPRLIVRLTNGSEVWPLGKSVWRDAWLVLSRELAGRRYRHLFTGVELEVREADGIAGLPLAEVFREFPVALLERLG